MNIEKGKTYLTRDGELVRVYATDGWKRFPIHAAVYSKNAEAWIMDQWTASGRAVAEGVDHGNDLVAEAESERANNQMPLFDGAVLT